VNFSDPTVEAPRRRLAKAPVLLVACDYDGTLAPIVERPEDAAAHRESTAALRAIASLADTHVAVISGRSLRDLAVLSRLPDEIHLVGSHGTEFDIGFASELAPARLELLDTVTRELADLAALDAGFQVERKPASVAFHYRRADEGLVDGVLAQIRSGPGARPGVNAKEGKKVIELSVVDLHKGTALQRIRSQVAAEAALFIGDDVTDEDAFATLTGPDLGLKVGPGDTLAHGRLDDTEQVAKALAWLYGTRNAWLMGDHAPPIERHTLLSDHQTVALITPEARLTWMCHPTADSPAVFAELVGGIPAGYFAVAPTDPEAQHISHRYLPSTLIAETRWAGLTVTDYLDCSSGQPYDAAAGTVLFRALVGSSPATIEFAPRLDFGRAPSSMSVTARGLLIEGAAQTLELIAPGIEWEIAADGPHDLASAQVDLTAGEPVVLELRFNTHVAGRDEPMEPQCREATGDYWKNWLDGLLIPDTHSAEVERSALTLKALCHQPIGTILAAATTSLPEVPGGVRNWDYRYCWPRDASLTAAALVDLGSSGEAMAFLGWLLERVERLPGPEQLRPVYPMQGDGHLAEAVLQELPGYKGSRPVRIGNAAEYQLQLDVFGPIVDLVHRLVRAEVEITEAHWRLVEAMVEAIQRRWFQPDHGIWEERRPRRHHVHSKVMCWQGVDRALAIAELTGRRPGAAWSTLRDEIAADVTERGWSPEVGAYTAAYNETDIDAAVLHIGLSGLLAADDERFVATVDAVEHALRSGPVVYRYRHDDGLPGVEGGFLLCSAWLIEALVMVDRADVAQDLLRNYVDLAGPTLLLSEMYDPATEQMLGNHPQAYSHVGLINAVRALAAAR
jgi:trehalose 6-phosphate phosphatase